jgi:hypothetical protein
LLAYDDAVDGVGNAESAVTGFTIAALLVLATFARVDALHDQVGCGIDHAAGLAGTQVDALVDARITDCARVLTNNWFAYAGVAGFTRIAVLSSAAFLAFALTTEQSGRAVGRAISAVRWVVLQILAPTWATRQAGSAGTDTLTGDALLTVATIAGIAAFGAAFVVAAVQWR